MVGITFILGGYFGLGTSVGSQKGSFGARVTPRLSRISSLGVCLPPELGCAVAKGRAPKRLFFTVWGYLGDRFPRITRFTGGLKGPIFKFPEPG